jgi:hypothetical protein
MRARSAEMRSRGASAEMWCTAPEMPSSASSRMTTASEMASAATRMTATTAAGMSTASATAWLCSQSRAEACA